MGNAKRLTQAEYERLKEAHEQASDAGLLDIEAPDNASATCAMLGGCYQLGDHMIPPIQPSTMPLLGVAGVSILSEPDEDAGDLDAIRDLVVTLYIIANGAESCNMLMGVTQRLRALRRLEHLAQKSPEMFERYLDKIDDIGGSAFAELETRAFQFVDSIEGFTYGAAFDVISQMIGDVEAAGQLIPTDGGGNDKKK